MVAEQSFFFFLDPAVWDHPTRAMIAEAVHDEVDRLPVLLPDTFQIVQGVAFGIGKGCYMVDSLHNTYTVLQ